MTSIYSIDFAAADQEVREILEGKCSPFYTTSSKDFSEAESIQTDESIELYNLVLNKVVSDREITLHNCSCALVSSKCDITLDNSFAKKISGDTIKLVESSADTVNASNSVHAKGKLGNICFNEIVASNDIHLENAVCTTKVKSFWGKIKLVTCKVSSDCSLQAEWVFQ